MKMKNNYKQRQRQIEKSINNDWNQNPDLYYEIFHNALVKDERKLEKPKMVIINGKLTRVSKKHKNGVPVIWDDVI